MAKKDTTPTGAADGAEPVDASAAGGFPMPDSLAGLPGAELLLEACNLFGVNPDPTHKVRVTVPGQKPFQTTELKSWRYVRADADDPDAVILVTAGGVKLKLFSDPDYPMDQATEDTLRRLFRAYTIDPQTKEHVPTALPDDLTLPRAAVDGVVRTTEHQYAKGYLREGGKTEGARRAAKDRARAAARG